MRGPVIVSPSILSADFLNLEGDIRSVQEAGCDWLHIDVMDGHFVENLTIGPPHVKALREMTDMTLDVHLMISNPFKQLGWYLDAGADVCTFHVEATDDMWRAGELIAWIHARGAKAGIALCPDTDVEVLQPHIRNLDMVLVMSVFPGFSGQRFIGDTPERVTAVCDMCDEEGVSPLIQVDGGINADTGRRVVERGADVLVAGNAVFNAPDRAEVISALHSLK